MKDLQVFKNSEFGEVRTVSVNGEPYVMLKDVCGVLEIGNPSQAKTRLKKDGVISNEVIDSLGRKQKADFINESNLYKIIFQSRKPQAEAFADWVTEEVLPTIRKHGAYMTDDVLTKTLENPDYMIGVLTRLKEEKEARLEAERTIEDQEIVIDKAIDDKATYSLSSLGSVLKGYTPEMGRRKIFDYMHEKNILKDKKGTQDHNKPMRDYAKYFEYKTRPYECNGIRMDYYKPYLKGSGVKWLLKRLAREGLITKDEKIKIEKEYNL